MSEPAAERARLEEAVVGLMVERGYEEMTAAAVAARAGVGEGEFDRHFDGLEDAVLKVYRRRTELFNDLIEDAYAAQSSWRDGLRAAAYAAARYVRMNPDLVRFGTVGMFGAGLMAQALREDHLRRLIDLIDAGRWELEDPDSVDRGVAERVFGSFYALTVKDARGSDRKRTAESYVPELMCLAVRPYLGEEAAGEELRIPPPAEIPELAPRPLRLSRTEMRHGVRQKVPQRYGQGVNKAGGAGDEAALRLARLPPGRHGLPREFVSRNQRDRLAAGTISVVAERGFNAATITQICAAAGVSRRTFYAYFASKEECFFAAYATIAVHLRVATDEAAAEQADWSHQVVAKLRASLEFLAANPDLARFSLIAPQRAGESVAQRYRRTMNAAVEYFCEGMPPPPATRAPSEAVAVSLVGGMVALVVRKVEADEGDDLPALLPDLVELFLTPYLGRAEAVRVAQDACAA